MRNWVILSKQVFLLIIIVFPFQSDFNFQNHNGNENNHLGIEDYGYYGWETSRSYFQDISYVQIKAIDNYIIQNDLNIDHFLLVKNGYSIAEKRYGFTTHTLSNIVKTFTATAIGLALQNQALNLSQKALDFFPELNSTNYHPWTADITIEHLLTMTAGFNTTNGFNYTGDFYHDVLKRPMFTRPGLTFHYDKYLYSLLAYIADEYYYEVLGTLSIFVEIMSITEQGYPLGYYGMSMTIDDVAKLGYVYTNNGIWKGNNFITNDWINESLTKQMKISESLYYGYSWLINEEMDCYSSGDFDNSQLFIIPKENIVFVIMSREYSQRYLEDYYYIIEEILLNKEYLIISGLSYGIPMTLGILLIWIIIRRFIKKD
jgi:CubicO group peptidase (beta-lactamase class C family)